MMTLKSLSGNAGVAHLESVLKSPGRRSQPLWMGAGGAALDVSGVADDEQIRTLIVEALHPRSDLLLPELIADGHTDNAALSLLRLGRKTAAESTKRPPLLGYDLMFAPAKSVSLALAALDNDAANELREAHRHALALTLGWLEPIGAVTRTRPNNVLTQVPTTGFVAAAVETELSSAGQPQLTTHLLISNRVLEEDGRWLAIDGRALHGLASAASSLYDAALEHRLVTEYGYHFVERNSTRGSIVRDLAGIDTDLIDRASTTRAFTDIRASLDSDFGPAATAGTRRKLDRWAMAAATKATTATAGDDVLHAVRKALADQPAAPRITVAAALESGRDLVTDDLNARHTWAAARGYSRIFRALTPADLPTGSTIIALADDVMNAAVEQAMSDGWELLSGDDTLLASRLYRNAGTVTGALILRRNPGARR
ncbi:hypothetical protein B2J88_41040 [Rhodococcus sp. SRB_17]|nr:hypothetical protein [Rhodococcus sp. SRB_17]